jgi:hypothetical protein
MRNSIIFTLPEMDGYKTSMGKLKNSYIILVDKPEGKRPRGRPRRRWRIILKNNLEQIEVRVWAG